MKSIIIHQDIKSVKRERGRTKRERKQRTAIAQNRPLKICTSQSLEPINMLPYTAKGTSQIWLNWGHGDLGGGWVVLHYLGGPSNILQVLKVQQGSRSRSQSDALRKGCHSPLLAWRMEEGGVSQGMQIPEPGKGKQTHSFFTLKASRMEYSSSELMPDA